MSRKLEGEVIDILLVEDNPGDVHLTKVAFEEAKVRNVLHVVEDGVLALKFLRREAPYQEVPQPDVVLLDLNLPGKHGREVLAEIKRDIALRHIPVVILTSSKAEEDIVKSYDLHANAYITKPVDIDNFLRVVQAIEDFWLTVVKLPSQTTGT